MYKMEHYLTIKKIEVLVCYNVDEPLKQHAKWKKPDETGQTLYDYDFIYIRCL